MLSQLTGMVVAGALATGAQGAQQSAPGGGAADSVVVRAVRFFRGDRTLVNGFVRVPHSLLDGIRLGPGGFAAFSVDISWVIPPDPEYSANSSPKVSLPPPLFLVISSSVLTSRLYAAGGSTC